MDVKLNIPDISTLLAKQCNIPIAKAELFSRMFFDIIIEGLEKDGLVKINGLGTFKIIEVASRGSVNVNTGEKIEIKGHRKLSFIPADALKDKVNEAFAMFEPVEVNDEYVDDEISLATETIESYTVDDIQEAEPEQQYEEIINSTGDEDIVQDEQKETVEVSAETVQLEQPVPSEQVEQPVQIEKTADKTDAIVVERKKKRPVIIYASILLLVIVAGVCFLLNNSDNKGKNTGVVAVGVVEKRKEHVKTTVQKENSDTVSLKKSNVIDENKEDKPFVLLEELEQTSLSTITLGDTLLYKSVGHVAVHKVAVDETLTKISLKYYNDKKLWPYLVKYNNMGNHNQLEIGMELVIPKLVPRK